MAMGLAAFRSSTFGPRLHPTSSQSSSFVVVESGRRKSLSLKNYFPLSRGVTCSAALVTSTLSRRERLELSKMDSALSSLFLESREGSTDAHSSEENAFMGSGETKSHSILQLLAWHEGDDHSNGAAAGALPRMDDASLQYANVMWFRGAYNAEIIVSENEPEESVVRRFRRAVNNAGVIRECLRRRYRETRQDTIKRKRQLAIFSRRKRPTMDPSHAWTQNAWRLSRESISSGGSSRMKKTKKRKDFSQFSGIKDAPKKDIDEDDDFWGSLEDEAAPGSLV